MKLRNDDGADRYVARCLSLVLFFMWITDGWDVATFGVASGLETFAFSCCVQASVGLTFLVCAIPTARTLLDGMPVLRPCAVAAAASVVLSVCAALVGGMALVVTLGVAKGAAYALFVRMWFGHCPPSEKDVFVTLLACAFVGAALRAGIARIGLVGASVISCALPLLGLVSYARSAGGAGLAQGEGGQAPYACEALSRRSARLQMLGLLLCGFASGIAPSASAALPDASPNGILVPFILIMLLVLVGYPRRETLLSGFILVACGCIACALMAPASEGWALDLVRTDLWVLMYFSMAWFSGQMPAKNGAMSPDCLRGFSALYLCTVAAALMAQCVDYTVACVMTLALLVCALVVFFLDATRRQGASGDVPVTAGGASADNAASLISERFGLSSSERDAMDCLARGYSLRRTAEQMCLSENAAKYHRHNVYKKLGVALRQELIDFIEAWQESDSDAVEPGVSGGRSENGFPANNH